MADKAAIFDSTIAHFRFSEAGGKPDLSGALAIEVHIIAPGWGSSGFYSEKVLQDACKKRVYPEGMHMHWDHPTAAAEQDQPARTLKDLVAVLTEDGHYEANGWDGPGVYTKAKIFPEWVEKVRSMDGHIGISHYVSGIAEAGEAPDGKKGPIIKELLPDALNTVDFVTVPGAGGHYRTLFTEMKVRADQTVKRNKEQRNTMADKQESLTLAEIRTNHPEVFDEMKKTISEELKIEVATKDQTKKLDEAATRIKTLEQENKDLKAKIAEKAARDYVTTEIGKAKLPEVSGKALTETLIKQVTLTEEGAFDADKFAKVVTEAIKIKAEEIAAIAKEMGDNRIHGNGGTGPAGGADTGKQLKESLVAMNMALGKTKDQAERMADTAISGR